MSPRRAVILSDLHLGPAGPLSTFHEGRALATFIAGLAAAQEPATELVLAGDVFDFLQIEGYDGFRADLAAERFQRILAGPETWPVMDALRTFGRRSGSEITLLAGNHDPEVLLDDVRGAFEEAIGRKGSVRYADDEPLAPGIGDRWPVWGRALGNAAGTVWVVHGDRWDPHNAIHRDALRTAVAKGHPVALPPGSQLVYRVLSQLQPENRWIPELKPEFPVVVPLLLYLDPRVTLPFLRGGRARSARPCGAPPHRRDRRRPGARPGPATASGLASFCSSAAASPRCDATSTWSGCRRRRSRQAIACSWRPRPWTVGILRGRSSASTPRRFAGPRSARGCVPRCSRRRRPKR